MKHVIGSIVIVIGICVICFTIAITNAQNNQGKEFKSHLTSNTGTIDCVSYLSDTQSVVWMYGEMDNLVIMYDGNEIEIVSISPLSGYKYSSYVVCVKY